MNEEDELDPKEQELKEEVDRYEAQNQEAFDMEEENEIRKRREGEGTRDFRDRISEGQYKANRKKQRRFETDDDIRKRIQAQDEKIAEERKQEQLDQDPELNKQREDMNQGDFLQDPEEGFQGNALLSAGFEITANTLLDIFSPFLPLQSGGSYAINLISQIIRDPSKIGSLNQLEAGAAAASSLIPGANQYASFLKGIKPATRGTQLARQIGRGAVSANLDVLGMKIGEGEEVTFEDLTAATVFGGGLGGVVGVTPELIKGKGQITGDLSKVFKNIRKRIDGGPELAGTDGLNFGQVTPEFEPTTAFAIKGGGSLPSDGDLSSFLANKRNRYDIADLMLRKADLSPESPYYKRLRAAARNVPEYVRRNEDGFLYFDYNLFKDSMRPKQHGRAYIQLFESDLDTVLNSENFTPDAGKGTKAFREFDIAEFRETFLPAAKLLGLTGKKTAGRMDVSNVHHIAALKGTMGIYDGLGFNSPMFKEINKIMKEELGGMGAERANLIRLVGGTADKGSPHQLAHFFLDEALGTRGQNFFTDDVLVNMGTSDNFRRSKARELARIVADSEKVARDAQDAYKRLADATLATDFKDIQNTLERLVTSKKLGFVKLNNVNYKPIIRETAERGGYNVRQFDELIEDIALIHKAVPTGSPKLIDELLFSPQLLKSQKSFQKLVIKIEERFGEQGVTGAQMRKILDAFDVRMQNAGVGQTGLFEDIPDNLIEDALNSLDINIKAKKTRASQKNQEKYKQDPDIN